MTDKPATYQFVLDVTVHDFEALRAAALAVALKTMSAVEWESLRQDNASPVAADLHMLFDPGSSPPGVEIEHGEVSFICGDPRD